MQTKFIRINIKDFVNSLHVYVYSKNPSLC